MFVGYFNVVKENESASNTSLMNSIAVPLNKIDTCKILQKDPNLNVTCDGTALKVFGEKITDAKIISYSPTAAMEKVNEFNIPKNYKFSFYHMDDNNQNYDYVPLVGGLLGKYSLSLNGKLLEIELCSNKIPCTYEPVELNSFIIIAIIFIGLISLLIIYYKLRKRG
ncbi:MAG: hypothetical protein COT15_04530 [Candidatus Diapherotrites archaeon CG08_land_8_20_14_0_20_34_12]|nr:MAG: hypothetical protein COT15_04530 [Candidatus Diapherotrites archaeon CG08_land_8_20_14_0_20_34_12]